MTIEAAVKACRETKYTGWQMVTFVQKYVNKHMKYATSNNREFPKTAFMHGKGNAWQQAWCVNYILKQLNIRSELVYTTKAQFFADKEKKQPAYEAGHIWCHVRLNDTVRDVCSCYKENLPGQVNFTPIAPVKRYNLLAQAGGYVNTVVKSSSPFEKGRL